MHFGNAHPNRDSGEVPLEFTVNLHLCHVSGKCYCGLCTAENTVANFVEDLPAHLERQLCVFLSLLGHRIGSVRLPI